MNYYYQTGRRCNRVRRIPPLIPHASPDGCWRKVSIDLITDLPVTSTGMDCICHIVCHFRKMSRVIVVPKSIDAKGIAKIFFKEIFPHYGLPAEIISDRDRRWNCQFWEELCRLIGIRFNLTTAYHPQSNGLVERANEVLTTALRRYVSSHQKDWDHWLPFMEFAINNSYKESIQCTPFSLNRITMPSNPLETITKHVIEGQSMVPESTVFMGHSTADIDFVQDDPKMGERTFIQAHAMFQWAKKCLHLSKMRMKERFDAKGVHSQRYKVNDMVWFSVINLRIRHPSKRTKLLPKFIGPLKVIETVGLSAVKLELPKYLNIHPTISISQLKPYHPRKGTVTPVIIDGQQEWDVTDIVNHNIIFTKNKSQSTIEFKVQWKGDCEDSWHEFSYLEGCLEIGEVYVVQMYTHSKKTNSKSSQTI